MKFYLLPCLFIMSCNSTHKQEKVIIKKTFITTPLESKKDTLIVFDIEGISSEGAEAKVNYRRGSIEKSTINIYGETGQASIIYHFENNQIKVFERKYTYKSEIENVKSVNDMILEYEITYFIDLEGNLIGKPIPNRIDVFEEFKKAVPFELK